MGLIRKLFPTIFLAISANFYVYQLKITKVLITDKVGLQLVRPAGRVGTGLLENKAKSARWGLTELGNTQIVKTYPRRQANGRQPYRKMTSMDNDLNGRRPQWKTTSMEDNLNGR